MKKTQRKPEWTRRDEGRKKAEQVQLRQSRINRKRERESITLSMGGTV